MISSVELLKLMPFSRTELFSVLQERYKIVNKVMMSILNVGRVSVTLLFSLSYARQHTIVHL